MTAEMAAKTIPKPIDMGMDIRTMRNQSGFLPFAIMVTMWMKLKAEQYGMTCLKISQGLRSTRTPELKVW
jgi:hypothetical protein